VQAAQHDVGAAGPIVVGDAIRAMRRRDVDLDHDQVGLVAQVELFDVLVLNADLVVIVQVAGERRESQRREERILARSAPAGSS
jgi:hypothetical protein